MTQIKERADEYVGRLASSFLGFPDILEGGKNGYIVGATEQRLIDIKKAVDVYINELHQTIDLLNKVGDMYGIYKLGEILSFEGCVKDFRKAMEE